MSPGDNRCPGENVCIKNSQAASQAVPPLSNLIPSGRAKVGLLARKSPVSVSRDLYLVWGRHTSEKRKVVPGSAPLSMKRASKEPGQLCSSSLGLQLFQETGALELAQGPRVCRGSWVGACVAASHMCRQPA